MGGGGRGGKGGGVGGVPFGDSTSEKSATGAIRGCGDLTISVRAGVVAVMLNGPRTTGRECAANDGKRIADASSSSRQMVTATG